LQLFDESRDDPFSLSMSDAPIVSVVMANFNGAPFIVHAVESTLRQSLTDIEIIVIDDASTDRSIEIVEQAAHRDDRIRIVRLPRNGGPGAARNAGIAAARGEWIAILDNDDMMHPGRLERLVGEADRCGAEICADNLLVFGSGGPPRSFLKLGGSAPRWIEPAEFVRSNRFYGRTPALGYLKPLIKTSHLRTHGIAYRPDLRIGEDYDLIVQLYASRARYRLTPDLTYFYRKHSRSISHRVSAAELEALSKADRHRRSAFDPSLTELHAAFDARRRSIERAADFAHFVTSLKSRRLVRAARVALARPGFLPLLRLPIGARIARLIGAGPRDRDLPRPQAPERQVYVISRQRLIGSTNGSSAYLISLCQAIARNGLQVRLVSPNPATFGRWPFLRLRPEMSVFSDISIRGALRVGRGLFLPTDPRVFLKAAMAVGEQLLLRARLIARPRTKPAPYAIAQPWSSDEELFIARRAPPEAAAVIADYAFLTPAIPYALSPSARSLVVMHDLFCSRPAQFDGAASEDSVAFLDETAELALLDRADAIIAIQSEEARFVADRLPRKHVVLAPMAVRTVASPQPGGNRSLLFVGSNTAPNVIGLRWFLEHVWPQIVAALPDCELTVAGSVRQHFPAAPRGVRFLSVVPDLGPLYTRAGVVISPLTAGSGLKIKLVEALGFGKAIVATPVSAQGVEQLLAGTVKIAAAAEDFAVSVIDLLTDDALRARKAEAALALALRHFSAEACYGDLVRYLNAPRPASPGQPA
jgi:glycosyltransferase involved in cell wall biosynthesis